MQVEAVDLQEDLEVGAASMDDYSAAVVNAAERLQRPLALVGWSMGGLLVLMASEQVEPDRVVLLEPSPPAELQASHPEVEVPVGTFDGESVYGAFPAGIPSRPESARARAERRNGVSVPSVACPTLVVHGRDFPIDRGREVARFYGADLLAFDDLDHWGLVLSHEVRTMISQWLARS